MIALILSIYSLLASPDALPSTSEDALPSRWSSLGVLVTIGA